MSWTLNTPPTWAPNAVATKKGWENPTTGEVLVAIRGLSRKAGASDVNAVVFGAEVYENGDDVSALVRFNEKVNVTAGASFVLTNSGSGGNITLYAAAQNDVSEVLFNKQVDNTTQVALAANAYATQTLTSDTVNVSDGDTVTIGSKVYTFQNTLTDVDGNVKIGANAAASLQNLHNAINASGGVAGTDYALATVAHTQVEATAVTATTVVVTALVAGTAANSIATTEVSTHLSWGAATLTGGTLVSNVLSIDAQTIGGTIIDANSAVKASGLLTLTDIPANDETVVLDGKTYTFKTTLSNTDGFVLIGASVEECIIHLVSAINLTGENGTAYAAATTIHSTISASQASSTTMAVVAKTAGTAGNSLTTTETLTNGSFGGATLSGGTAGTAANKAISADQATAMGTRTVQN